MRFVIALTGYNNNIPQILYDSAWVLSFKGE